MRPTNRRPRTTKRLPAPCPLHEPPPLPPFGHPLPRGGGEGRGEGAVGWFKGARRDQSSGRSLHEARRTSNTEHRMAERILAHFGVRSSMLYVRCFPSTLFTPCGADTHH